MIKTTRKQLKYLLDMCLATRFNRANKAEAKHLIKIAYSLNSCGVNGYLLKNLKDNELVVALDYDIFLV